MSHACEHHHLDRNLLITIFLNTVIVIAEIAGGLLSSSLALVSDAMHNLSDVTALLMAWIARRFSRRSPSESHTYGLGRLEVIAALVNSATLLIVLTLIFREAVIRIFAPHPVSIHIMLPVAIIGLAANLISMLLLRQHSHSDLNMRGAFIHLLQDTLSSVVVVAAALLVGYSWGQFVDPAASMLVAVFVLRSGYVILRESLHILMEGTPRGIDVQKILREVLKKPGIRDFHHLHVWQVIPGEILLTAHVRMDDMPLHEAEKILAGIRQYLKDEWGVGHATLEMESRACETPGFLDSSHSNHH